MVTSHPEPRIALVTGAAGTMGKAAVAALLKDGVHVVMADLDEKALDRARVDISASCPSIDVGRKTHLSPFDVSNREACRDAVRRATDAVGSINILVNNAGILTNNKALETSQTEWRTVFAVNLDGAFFLSQAVLTSMREKRWGRIINTCSYAAKSGGLTAGTAYSVSKAALVGLTFSLAAETTKDNITVNGIAPAYVRTPMVTEQLTDEQRKRVEEGIPVGRFCEPEEFGHVVSFLASPLAGFITGEIIDQNGGLQFD